MTIDDKCLKRILGVTGFAFGMSSLTFLMNPPEILWGLETIVIGILVNLIMIFIHQRFH